MQSSHNTRLCKATLYYFIYPLLVSLAGPYCCWLCLPAVLFPRWALCGLGWRWRQGLVLGLEELQAVPKHQSARWGVHRCRLAPSGEQQGRNGWLGWPDQVLGLIAKNCFPAFSQTFESVWSHRHSFKAGLSVVVQEDMFMVCPSELSNQSSWQFYGSLLCLLRRALPFRSETTTAK